jgi:hypothetical protein
VELLAASRAFFYATNAEIAKNPQYADFSLDQSQLGVEGFYDRMDDVMSPSPLDPTRAMEEAITMCCTFSARTAERNMRLRYSALPRNHSRSNSLKRSAQ